MMSNIYNKLSLDYDKLYIDNIKGFQEGILSSWNGDEWFVDFYPSIGIKKNAECDFIFYGQAVNGWTSGFDLHEIINEEKLNTSIFSSNKYPRKLQHTPLDWVNAYWSNTVYNSLIVDKGLTNFYKTNSTYRTYRSFFWNVVYKLVNDFLGFERGSWEWSKKTVWSNLYKIAPDGSNPNTWLREKQFETSFKLFKRELEELNPKYCIVLTNIEWWNPFKIKLGAVELEYNRGLMEIQSFELYNNTKIIVTTRPRFGSGETHVKQILELLTNNTVDLDG